MKKNYLIVLFALVCNFAMAQIQATSYKGAFAPAPATMWTAGWTNFDPNNAAYPGATVQVGTDVTSNTTWTSGNVYQLNGLITVRNNAVLTIQPGTVIRSSQAASALVITRGSRLIANGTAEAPIVFTSNSDAGQRRRGDWGGIVMLGRARYNINNGVNFIEGLTQTVNTEFGGGLTPDNNDNSGILRYVRIEFAGYVFSPNNELNGLTMGAVGRGTTIENVQVSYSNDDSFEWFGGSVNCRNLVAFAGLDDDFDVDNGYTGIVQFGLSIKDPSAADISTSEIFEVDNNAGGSETTVAYGDYTSPIFSNITCVGPNARPASPTTFVTPAALHDNALRLRRASRANIYNSIFLDSRRGLNIQSTFSNTAYNATTPTASFRNNTIASPIPLVLDATGAAGATAATQTWFGTSGNVAIATNGTTITSAGILTRPYNATSATNYNLITNNDDTTGIDLRPASSDARTGAAFTDTRFTGLVALGNAPSVTTPTINYCRGVVASPLTATLTANGVSLVWYSKPVTFTIATVVGGRDTIVVNPDGTQTITAVGGADILTAVRDTPLSGTPTPLTTVVGTRYYYVAELNAAGVASARAQIIVNVLAAPTEAIGTITAADTASGAVVTNVGSYISTTNTVTYTVAEVVGVTDYFWTLPLGVNILPIDASRPNIGQGFRTIIVSFTNVPSGVLKVGNITVQARNAAFCGGPLRTLAIAATLPAAPRVVMNDPAVAPRMTTVNGVTTSTPVAVTSFARYMGTTTPLNLVATSVVAPNAYIWELPTGVNANLGTVVGTPVVRNFSVYPFTVAVSAPSNPGNVFYVITTTTYSSGVSITTGRIRGNGGTTGGTTFTAFDRELTNLTNEGVTVSPAYPITSSTSNVISVNFAGVTAANTFNYLTSATVPVSTNVLRIGVRSVNGVGASVTNNATAVNPPTSSSAVQLRLTAIRPAAPASIVMRNPAVAPVAPATVSPAVTVISRFVGTTTPFTLTATPSLLASSYSWELPAGVNLLSGDGSLSTNVISVNFAGVPTGTTAVNIGVRAVNGIGSSVTVNAAPNDANSARLLRLTAAVPAAVTAVTGPIAALCPNVMYDYTIAPSLLATSYTITAPANSIVRSASNMSNNSNVLSTTDLTFTVMYPAGFVATTTAPQSLVVASVNGVGTSLTNRTLALSTLLPAVGTVTSVGGIASFNQGLTAKVFTVATNPLFTGYTWTAANGAVIVSGQGASTVTVDFSGVVGNTSTTSAVITVAGTTACGQSAPRAITLRYNAATTARLRQEVAVNATEVYPNPVSSNFNIDVTAATAGALEISIYSLDNNLVASPKTVQLQEGANTISENVSSLNSGIYIVKLVNSSTGEVITKKLVKN